MNRVQHRAAAALARCIVVTWLAVITLAAQAVAQSSLTITGRVEDAAGAPVRGANVVMEEMNRSAVSDDSGHFTIRGLTAGRHHLRVEALGYAPTRFMAEAGAAPIVVVLTARPVEEAATAA